MINNNQIVDKKIYRFNQMQKKIFIIVMIYALQL